MTGIGGISQQVTSVPSDVRLRQILASHADLAARLEALEQKYDAQFRVVFDAIRQMMTPEEKGRKGIGFRVEEEGGVYL